MMEIKWKTPISIVRAYKSIYPIPIVYIYDMCKVLYLKNILKSLFRMITLSLYVIS